MPGKSAEHLVAQLNIELAKMKLEPIEKAPEGLPGHSIKAQAQATATRADNHFVVAETQTGTRRGWMLRTTRYKYCFYNEGKNREVLFDMEIQVK